MGAAGSRCESQYELREVWQSVCRPLHIKALLEYGVDINLSGGQYGFPLQAAACSDKCDPENLQVIQLLLEKGADVNAQGGEYGTALQAASYHHRL